MRFDAFALSATGRRHHNEDAICARPDLGLFVVADGMGGYAGGEIASGIAVAAIEELVARTAGDQDITWPYAVDPRQDALANEVEVATRLAGDRIVAERRGGNASMGTTVAMVRLASDRVAIGHVGDSRVYRLRDGALTQLTIDHSLVEQLIAAGVTPEPDFAYRNVITRALGTPTAEPDLRIEPLRRGDVFLLCSDGLCGVVGPALIAARLALPARAACECLLDDALAAGSSDNISVIVVRVL